MRKEGWKGQNNLLSCPNKYLTSFTNIEFTANIKKHSPCFPELLHKISSEPKLPSTWSQTQKSSLRCGNTCSQVQPYFFYLVLASPTQSCTLFGRTRSGLPSPRGRWTRSGTADTTSGCWRESWCILDSGCPNDDPGVFIFLSAGRSRA